MTQALPAALMSHPAQILVVDDDSELRGQTADYLSEHGYGVHAAADAKEMDAVLAAQPVDLIILDVMLPGEGGLSICQRLARSAGMSIIMLSAMGEEVDRVLGLELGADDYLTKPFSLAELLARVKALLRRAELLRAAQSGASGRPAAGPLGALRLRAAEASRRTQKASRKQRPSTPATYLCRSRRG